MVERVRVQRHALSTRVVHWVLVAEGSFLLLSGLQLTGILNLGLPDIAYSLHVTAGLIFLFTALAFVYVVAITREYKWFSLTRLPYSAYYNTREMLGWLRIMPPVAEPILYDASKHEYVEKLVPSVIVVWWGYITMGAVLALTGLADAFPGTFWFVYSVANPIGVALTGVGGLSFLMAIHRLAAFLLLATVTSHVYAAFVFKLLSSITRGDRDEPVVSGNPSLP